MKQKKKKKSKGLPKGVDEAAFLIAIDNICKKLVYKFKFGYHNVEDMKQQAIIFALEGLKNYDSSRPLENFLWTHIHNRLFNFKRDNYQRPDKPCLSCPLYDKFNHQSTSGCLKYSNKNNCELYDTWENRNQTKKNILTPSSLEHVSFMNTPGMSPDDMAYFKEIDLLINNNLPVKYREFYLKLKNGCKIKKVDLTQLQKKIKEILQEHNKSTEYFSEEE
jgi:hypothetical protein